MASDTNLDIASSSASGAHGEALAEVTNGGAVTIAGGSGNPNVRRVAPIVIVCLAFAFALYAYKHRKGA